MRVFRDWSAVVVGAVVGLGVVQPAQAQLIPGLAIGEELRRGAPCPLREGSERLRASTDRSANAAIERYINEAYSPDQASILRAFERRIDGIALFSSRGALNGRSIRDPYATPMTPRPTAVLQGLSVSTSGHSARGIWSLSRPTATDPNLTEELRYVADIEQSYMGGYAIRHIRVFAPGEALNVDLPQAAFCDVRELEPLGPATPTGVRPPPPPEYRWRPGL